jgi:hypothetical protein
MRTKRAFILLLFGVVLCAMAATMLIPPVMAQTCDPAQYPNGCPPPPEQPTEKQPKKRPTKVPISIPKKTSTPTVTYTLTVTSTFTPTPTSTFTSTPSPSTTALPITGSGAGSNNPNSELPAVQDPDQGSSPFSFPGSLGMIIAVLIIVVCLIGGLFLARRRRLIGSRGESELLPYMERGGSENATITVPGFGDLGNENATITSPSFDDLGNENFTITVKDSGDISPDAIRNVREAASDPGGIQLDANPGGVQKPPTHNIGDKSGGGTL